MSKPDILSSPSPPSEEPGTVLFETERLIVRRYFLSDAPSMALIANDPAVAAHLRATFPSPYTLSDAETFLTMACTPKGTSYPERNGVFIKPHSEGNPGATPLFIGSIGIIPYVGEYSRTWEVGYWLGKSSWGKGYATEAVKAFTVWLFETWPELNRLEAVAEGKNEASIRVLKKSGFVEEGRKRGAIFKRGKVIDEVVLGLLREDLVRDDK